MSVAYYIVIDNDEPKFDTFVNGKAVAHALDEIDVICEGANLPKIDSFMGQSAEEISDMLGEEVSFPEGEGQGNKWFDPDEGIALFEALIALVRANPQSVNSPDEVIDDLAEYKRVLHQAKDTGAKWHLALDI